MHYCYRSGIRLKSYDGCLSFIWNKKKSTRHNGVVLNLFASLWKIWKITTNSSSNIPMWHITMQLTIKGRRGRDRMVVGFTTTYAISTYYRWCEFESRSGRGVQHYVIKFVKDLRQVGGFLRILRFPPQIKLIATI